MKKRFFPILIVAMLASKTLTAQSGSGGSSNSTTISLKGDSGTEQAAKLELIRILNERLNKLTVSQLNARIIVSRGVTEYYKVKEIKDMQEKMWTFRSRYVTQANKLENANPGFAAGGFAFKYINNYNSALETADMVRKQLDMVVKSGTPIQLPPMPSFDITPAASADDLAGSLSSTMQGIMSQYGITSQADIDNLPADKKASFQAAVDAAKAEFEKQLKSAMASTTKSSLTLLGNVVGTLVGIPGAGSLIAGIASGGGAGAISGLVGSIVDRFQIPDDYYNSQTLKLTDAERLKIIDELHIRISEAYQQTIALGASMNSETKARYNELSQPRNDVILYGPKKP